jgi:hypothetical protein
MRSTSTARAGWPSRYDTFGEFQWGWPLSWGQDTAAHGYDWMLWSLGPGRTSPGAKAAVNIIVRWEDPNHTPKFWPYDPTNGTMSAGFIVRTNKGVFPQ